MHQHPEHDMWKQNWPGMWKWARPPIWDWNVETKLIIINHISCSISFHPLWGTITKIITANKYWQMPACCKYCKCVKGICFTVHLASIWLRRLTWVKTSNGVHQFFVKFNCSWTFLWLLIQEILPLLSKILIGKCRKWPIDGKMSSDNAQALALSPNC